MTLLPEQLRALAYARKRGTNSSVEEIRARVRATFSEIEALVSPIPADVARGHRATSAWSVQEVVDHLVETDRRAMGQLSVLLSGRDVDEAIPASLQSAQPLDLDWHGLLQQFRSVHENVLELLAGAGDELPQSATAPVQMVVKCSAPDGELAAVSWLERFDWKAFCILLHAHNREHMAQIQRILSAPPTDEESVG